MRTTLSATVLLLASSLLEPAHCVDERPEKQLGREAGSRATRPELPLEVAEQVKELEAKIEDLRKKGIGGDDRAKQDEALDEAIKLAEEVLAAREKHQAQQHLPASEAKKSEWWEVADARWNLRTIKLIAGMDAEARKKTEASLRESNEGSNLFIRSQYEEAEQPLRTAADHARRVFQGDHPVVATTLDNLARLLRVRGDLSGAEPLFRESLEMRRRLFVGDHPHIALSLKNLAMFLRYRGNLQEAEPLLRDALDMARRLYPGDHPDLVTSLNDLALVLQDRHDLQAAEALLKESLDICRRLFPGHHADVAGILNNLALLLQDRGDLKGAEPLLRESYDIKRRLLSGDHLDIARSLNNLAVLLQDRGDLQTAQPLLKDSLDMSRRLFPGDHFHVATSFNNLASLLQERGDLQAAEPLFRESLDMWRRLFPGDHRHVATSLNNLALLLLDRGDLQGAESLFWESLDMHRRLFPGDHRLVATSLNNLARMLHTRGDLHGAEPLFREALDMRRRLFSVNHPDVARSLNNLAMLLLDRGDLQGAEPLLRESHDMRRRLFQGDHPDVALSLNNLATLLQARADFQGAEALFRESLDIRRRLFPGDHPHVASSLNNLAILLQARGDLQGAEASLRDALHMVERLRPQILGDEKARAEFSEQLRIASLASRYAAVVLQCGRPSEVLGVCERGRARSFLDLLERGALDVLTKAKDRSAIDTKSTERLQLVLAHEEKVRTDLTTAETLLAGLQKERKQVLQLKEIEPAERELRLAQLETRIPLQLGEVRSQRRNLSEASGALFVELRGLFPEARPLSTEEVLAGLPDGDVILSYIWSDERVVLATAGEGGASGAVLAASKKAVQALLELTRKLSASLVSPSEGFAAGNATTLLAALLPEEARVRAGRARRLVILPDGPLHDIPFDVLLSAAEEKTLRGKSVVYAASATIYLQRLSGMSAKTKPNAVVLGAPIYDRDPLPRPKYPEKGALIADALAGGNAATAGLRRGDVVLTYDGHDIEESAGLSEAITALSAVRNGERHGREAAIRFWRNGEEKETRVQPGKLGVQIVQGDLPSALRLMARSARGFESLVAEASTTDQVRLFGGSLEPLPGTRREALAIAQLIMKAGGEIQILVEEAANTRQLAAASPGKRFIHLATHGLRGSSERPFDASLALTRPREITLQDIGFLRLEDLLRDWRGKLEGTQLVVLSACESQRGAKVGDSAMSLPWGFFYAGARTVIGSLWKVDDQATSFLMVRLYENLLGVFEKPRTVGTEEHQPGEGMGPEAALREAKSWLRSLSGAEAKAERLRVENLARSGAKAHGVTEEDGQAIARGLGEEVISPIKSTPKAERPFEHPYYWAAFVCMGSPE